MSRITSSEPDFLLASPQLTIFPGHSTLIFPTAAGKLTTERWESRFRRQFLPISRKWPELEAAVPSRVGAVLPAKPYFFAGSRQHAPVFLGRSPAVLAPASLRSFISSPGHANMLRFFLYSRRPCWRRPPCEALFLHRATPTCSGFSCIVGGRVGAVLPARLYFFAESRQHAPIFPGRSPAELAPSFLLSLISSPGHANMLRFFSGGRRPCWRRPPCEALFLRRATPTCSGFTHIAGGFVGVFLPAKPYFFAESRQHAPVFPGRSAAALAPSFLRSLISSPGHANMLRFFPGGRRPCWHRPPCEALFLRRVTPTCSGFSRAVPSRVGAVLPAWPYFFAGSRQRVPHFPSFFFFYSAST